MKTENWKKLVVELRIENKELKAQLEAVKASREGNSQLKTKLGELQQKINDLETSKRMAERAIRDSKDQYIYATGILSVLKRLSGLYPEEGMTHEEYLKSDRGAYREILSEVDLPF